MKGMLNIALSVFFFGVGCFCFFGSYMMLTVGIDLIKNDGYSYDQNIYHNSNKHEVFTLVRKDGKMIQSWIDEITDDSTAKRAEKKAQEFIQLMKSQ